MRLHEVRLEDCPPQPWRNGGGLTHEMLAWPTPGAQAPAGSGAEAWLVRVSVAQIGRDGPFSAFPGVDRAFAVLEGTGVALTFGGGAAAEGERLLTADDEALNFPGEDAPGCRLAGGPGAATLDLNLMGRREAGRRAVMEEGGKKEILMMVPVVFLVLPVTVFFAFWPGVVGLHLTAP